MGLDTVELVFAAEKLFSIEILDREAAGLVTVGMLHTWVLSANLGVARAVVHAALSRHLHSPAPVAT
jgi:hypothetical protein